MTTIFERRSRLVDNAVSVLRKAHVPTVHRESGISATSLYRLRKGLTRSPHLKTVEFAMRSLGHTLTMVMGPDQSKVSKKNGKNE
jgi:DNA-binding phage protein